jgi:hypothetical protein
VRSAIRLVGVLAVLALAACGGAHVANPLADCEKTVTAEYRIHSPQFHADYAACIRNLP